MQLPQVNENQIVLDINLGVTSSFEVTITLPEVRGQIWGMCDLQLHFDSYHKIPTSDLVHINIFILTCYYVPQN